MKQRLDILVTEKGLAPSREKARALIMAGEIFVNGQRGDKPGDTYDVTSDIVLHGNPLPFVSRGGLKLKKAVECFGLTLTGLTCVDVGASTGGFTDCMLQNGAVKVYAVDVGYGQLDWKLRNDPRVICMEKTNARYLTVEQLGEPVDLATSDVSFISLTKVLQAMKNVLKEDGQAVCLIKPQFEAGREKVGKKGVVRDKATHMEVIGQVSDYAREIGFSVLGLDHSPIKGPEGNIEYLIRLGRGEDLFADAARREQMITGTVDRAHEELA